MSNYFYTAKSLDGKTQTGVLDAKDERQIAQNLKDKGLILIKAVIEDKKTDSKLNFSIPFLGVSSTEKIIMVRNMGVMFSTGLSLVKSFDILSIQTKNKKLKSALLDIKEKINKGESLSDSLAKYPNIFS